MECVDLNANTYIDKLDKLVLSMIEPDNEFDTEYSSWDNDMTGSGQGANPKRKNDIPIYEMRW